MALVGTLAGFVGIYYSVQLYKNLRTDVEELLPNTARSVVDLDEVTSRLESIDNLAVLMFSQDAAASKRFVIDLARKLETLPRTTVSSVEYRIDKELTFFQAREALYMDLSDLIKIRTYIQDRIDYEKELYNPLNIFRTEDLPQPTLDFDALRRKYEKKTSAYSRFPDGFYASPDGTKRVLLAYMPGKTSSISQVHRLKDAVARAVEELNPKSYATDLVIKYTGGVQDSLEEQSSLIADLELSTIVVTVLVSLAMLLFFRNLRATFALVFSLFMGTFWTFGLSYFVVGYLNANSAFLGSIVIGNGINVGIIFLARYLEERRRGRGNTRAVRIAMTTTSTATGTAALAAGLSYGSLILTGFRGFRQFGTIGLIGMVLCWISAFTVLPAFLTLFDRMKNLVPRGTKSPRAYFSDALAKLVGHAPHMIWGFSLALTLVSLGTFVRYSSDIIETDLSKLRNKESLERGSAFLSHYLDDIFQRYLAPIVLLPHTREDAQKIADLLKEKKKVEGPGSLIASVQTMDDFIPPEQGEKIKVLQEIRSLLPQRLLLKLSGPEQNEVRSLLNPMSMHPLYQSELPQLVINKFTERDGSVGKLVLVEPPLANTTWNGDKLLQFINDLRSAADSVEPRTAVAGALPIVSDMYQAIVRDGPRATLFAFAAVVILVIFLFRSVETVSLILFALILGVTWLVGIILGFGLKINFLNFIALPITFGIGVDYGVNMFQRYRQEGGANILNTIRHTGGAVGLCSFTTIVGYCSLVIAGNQAFVSFGTLAVAGELTCVTAAVVSLPAYLLLMHRKKSERES